MPHPIQPPLGAAPLRALAVAFPIALAAAPAGATQNPFAPGPSSSIPWSGAVDPTRAVAGDFTGDSHVDVVFLTGDGSATLVYGPGTYSALVNLGAGIVDVARLERGPSLPEGLLVLDGAGLRALFDYSGGSFDVLQVAGGAPWATALRVAAGDADGDGLPDAVGVAADGQTILFASDVHAGAAGPSSFPVPGTVLDLVVADWGPAPAIVVLTTDGLHVRRHTGAVVDAYGGGDISAGALTVFREAGLDHDRTAAVYTVPGSGDFVSVVDKDGPADIVPLGAIGAYGIDSGDVDGDQLDDLVVLQRTNHFAILLRHQGLPGDPFGPMEGVNPGHAGIAAPDQTGAPVLADLTNDGDLDLLVHVAVSEDLVLVENLVADRTAAAPRVDEGVYLYSEANDVGELRLEVLQPPGLHFAADSLEVVVWVEDPAEEGEGMQAGALHHLFFDLDAAGGTDTSFFVGEADVSTANIYHIEMRAVATQGTGVLQAGPAAVWSFATASDDVATLEGESGNPGVPIRVFLIDEVRYLSDEEEDERVLTPSTVKGDKVPPMDEPPDPFAET